MAKEMNLRLVCIAAIVGAGAWNASADGPGDAARSSSTAAVGCERITGSNPLDFDGYRCTDEASFLAKLAELGFITISEGFENAATWGNARSPDTRPSVTSQDMVWLPNNAVSSITTGPRSRTGSWGLFESPHGDGTGSATSALRDGFVGSWNGSYALYGVGCWLSANTGGAKVRFVIGDVEVAFADPNVPADFTFFGVIDLTGFVTFEVYETEGVVEDQEFIFADDVTFATRPAPSAGGVFVPVIAHLAGVGGTAWRSDVAISNPGPDAVDLTLKYSPGGLGPYEAIATVGAHGSLLYNDMVASTFFDSGEGRGPLQVEWEPAAAPAPVIVARTYAATPLGNFGSGLPAVGIASGEPVIIPGLFHDADYRSSLLVTAGPAAFTLAAFDLYRGADGLVASTNEHFVAPASQDQWLMSQLFPGVARSGVPMTVVVTLTSPGIAYGSMVDNVSSDSAVTLGSAAAPSWLVPVVAHLPGREGTFWSSDVALWNASASEATVDLEFLPENTDNSAGGMTAAPILLAPYETVVLEDVVAADFGLANAKGALRVDASAPVVVTSRVVTAAPGGGTSGNGVRCMSVARMVPGQVVLPGVRTLGGFRSNVGIATGDLGATFELLLYGADGMLLGSSSLAVPARSLRQLSTRELFGSMDRLVDPVGSVEISADVAFAAYMTVIDGTSQDPVFVMPD
jgi:hypothetical protein